MYTSCHARTLKWNKMALPSLAESSHNLHLNDMKISTSESFLCMSKHKLHAGWEGEKGAARVSGGAKEPGAGEMTAAFTGHGGSLSDTC